MSTKSSPCCEPSTKRRNSYLLKAKLAQTKGLDDVSAWYEELALQAAFDEFVWRTEVRATADDLAERGEYRAATDLLVQAGIDPENVPIIDDEGEDLVLGFDDFDERIAALTPRVTKQQWRRIYKPHQPKKRKKYLCATRPVKGVTRRKRKKVWFSILRYKDGKGIVRAMKRIVAHGWQRRPQFVQIKGKRMKMCRPEMSSKGLNKRRRMGATEVTAGTVYDKVKWHYPDGNAPNVAVAKQHFAAALRWLAKNHMLTSQAERLLKMDADFEWEWSSDFREIPNDFALTSDLLTSAGNSCLQKCYRGWLRNLSYSTPPNPSDYFDSCCGK